MLCFIFPLINAGQQFDVYVTCIFSGAVADLHPIPDAEAGKKKKKIIKPLEL